MQALRLLALLLVPALDAAAGVISLQMTLSPSPSGLSAAAPPSPLASNHPLALSPFTPTLSAAHAARPVPFGAIPLDVAPVKAAVPVLPKALAGSAIRPAASIRPAKLIDSLRLHGAESGELSKLGGENGKAALERSFLSAASLGDGVPVDGGAGEGDGSNLSPKTDSRPLLERMLEKVQLDDRGRADEKKALADAFARMLDTPTGRRYAEEFLAEGMRAVVHFEDFPDSELYLVDGRKKFYAAQAYTDWRDDYSEIRINRHYVDGDPEYLKDSLPGVLGHELLGHGLWYGRAAKENLFLAFHYHELNETHARVVGWSIDHELDGRIEDPGAWTYLQDPAHYLATLKMALPYYAVTFSRREMADAIGTMKARLEAAKQSLAESRQGVVNQRSWLGVIEHFTKFHGAPAERFERLKREMDELVSYYTHEVKNFETIVREVGGLIDRLEAEPNRDSQLYLQQSSRNPFFARLESEIERATNALRTRVAAQPPAPRTAQAPAAWSRGQITWEELRKMYDDDFAADAKRPAKSKHWVHKP